MATRREFLALGGAAAATAMLGSKAEGVMPYRRRVLRVAHITDIHVQPEGAAPNGMQRCLDHAQDAKPDLILTGGDQIMDALNCDSGRAKAQWDVYQRVLRYNIGVPVRHCIGNHDVFGWASVSASEKDPLYGKRCALDRLEMDRPYYSFTEAGWHFIVLDSTHRKTGPGYTARLDEAQFEWLEADLKNTPSKRPICVVSHIPILSACALFDGDNERPSYWHLPGAWMHLDARRIKDLFKNYANVKACISGHIHLVDSVRYLGVQYMCNGAASGGWWKGPYQECRNGYALLDFYNDGTVMRRYVDYEWKA